MPTATIRATKAANAERSLADAVIVKFGYGQTTTTLTFSGVRAPPSKEETSK